MSRRTHIIGLGLLVAAATTVPAYAQSSGIPTAQSMATDFPVCTKKASDADQELAKQKFIAARQDYEEGTYDQAIKRFKATYDLDCSKPELLLIISSAYEKKGDKPAALAALEVYTQRAPKDAPDMETTKLKIENMKKTIAATPPPSSSSPPKQEESSGHTVFPWIVVGVGAAGAIVGVVLLATAPDNPSNCNPDTATCTKDPSLADSPQAQQNKLDDDRSTAGRAKDQPLVGAIITAAGGAVLVGGLVWHFLEPTDSKTGRLSPRRLSPSIAPGYAGLSYGLKF